MAILKVNNITLDDENFIVTINDHEINPSLTEFKLLKYLMENTHRVVPKEELLEKVWGKKISANTVEVYVRYLRHALGDDAITTRRGFGYRIVNRGEK